MTTVAAGVIMVFQAQSVRAIIPVMAEVDSKATGNDGNTGPLCSGLPLGVEVSF
jgi:hypothetical protein